MVYLMVVYTLQAQGMCFRRVIWGHGPHLLYVDSMVALRRKASEFLRLLVLRSFDIRVPREFHHAPPVSTTYSGLPLVHGGGKAAGRDPLRIVVYSRGSSGKGRSMKGEELLVSALQQRGAAATLCCDFGRLTLDQQLSYAVHADVVSYWLIVVDGGRRLVHDMLRRLYLRY